MIVAVDLGSTNFKAALFNEEGRRLATASRPLPYTVHTNDRAELDPTQVRDCFLGLLQDTVRKGRQRPDCFTRIALTSQAQTFTILGEDGAPITPFIGWSDNRAGEEAASLTEALGGTFHRRAGWAKLTPRQMISKVLWWKRRNDTATGWRIASLPAWLGMQLGAALGSDANLAAMSGFYSITDGHWWTEALDAAGVTPEQLGCLVPPGVALPRGGEGPPSPFDPDLEVAPVGNDHTAGAFACDCHLGRPILTLGTAGVLFRHAGADSGPYSANGLWGPYPSGGYYELKSINHACSAVDWADEFVFGSVDSPRFVAFAEQAAVTSKTPFFYPDAWGSANAWTHPAEPADMTYSALEGVLFALRHLGGETFFKADDEIVILGGGSRLDFWVQLAADCFNRPIRRTNTDGIDGAAGIAGNPVMRTDDSSGERFLPSARRHAFLTDRFEGWRAKLSHVDLRS